MTAYIIAMATQVGLYALLALGLNLQWGYTGLLNFGVVGFFALGAYTYALVSGPLGLPPAIGFLAAIAAGAIAALPLGLASIRLRVGFYLAIVTLGFGEVVRSIIVNERWLTNGTRGLPVADFFPGLSVSASASVMLALVLTALAVVFVLLERLGRSPYGRTIEAIRENEDAARSLGKPVAGFKVEVFMLGAAIAAAVAAFNAVYVGYLVPDQFLPILTFYVWMAVIVGGRGSNRGVVLTLARANGANAHSPSTASPTLLKRSGP
ncbi:branched-chain amino acid ABC transporter permease [Amorphus sp. 3PC139-8]|uniref:branched-chain amino acid ABC transporter permease n=1 Tax=Amorphus sp. 3PC139-8 TaxID=2735676 RepID=UPI00345DA2E8